MRQLKNIFPFALLLLVITGCKQELNDDLSFLNSAANAGSVRIASVPPRASTTATSAVEAAVTMLRVYCSWPGASAMMNLRVLVAK